MRCVTVAGLAVCVMPAGMVFGQVLLPVLYSNFSDTPTSLVPSGVGVSTELRFEPGREDVGGNAIFQKTNQSPSGHYWSLTATVNTATPTSAIDPLIDELVVVGSALPGQGVSGKTVMRENSAFPLSTAGIVAGEAAGIFDLDVPINDAGQFALTTLLRNGSSASNGVLMRGSGPSLTNWEVVAREGAAVAGGPGLSYGFRQFGAEIRADGTTAFISERLNNVLDRRGVFTESAPVIVRPGGVGLRPVFSNGTLADAWGAFSPPIQSNGSGSMLMVRGFLASPLVGALDAVTINNTVVALGRNAATLNFFSQAFGGFNVDPVGRAIDELQFHDMAGSGSWLIGGRLSFSGEAFMAFGQNLMYTNRLVTRGSPLFAGATEAWGEEDFLDVQAVTFTNMQIDNSGRFAATGFSNNANENRNGVLVFDGQCVLAREGDGVDVNGNGLADDNAFVLGFRRETMSLSGGVAGGGLVGEEGATPAIGTIMVVADVVRRGANPNGSQDVFGQVVLNIRATCCRADVGSEGGATGPDGLLDNNDFIVFVNGFFTGQARSDIGVEGGAEGSDGLFDNNDFIVFVNRFFVGC